MRIEVGKYMLCSDEWCYWINEVVETRNKRTKELTGKTKEYRVAGYVTSIERLLKDFRSRTVGGADAENIIELLEVLKQTYEDMDALNTAAVERDFKKIREMIK